MASANFCVVNFSVGNYVERWNGWETSVWAESDLLGICRPSAQAGLRAGTVGGFNYLNGDSACNEKRKFVCVFCVFLLVHGEARWGAGSF